MAVIKVYTRINWLNKSESLTTPLGKTNLNKMDKAINLIDDEVVSMSAKIDEIDTTKVSADQLNNMVTDVSFNDKNGVISITKHNGTVLNIDTAMEKIAVNFEYNAHTQKLILTLENGDKQYIDMSALITQYEFKDTDTIAFSIDNSGKVSASIKSGSITKTMLSSEVMSAITLSENNAAASAQAAAQSATNADMDAKLAQSYSVGKSGIRDGEDTDNSKYYSEQAKKYADEAQEIAGGNFIPNSEKGIAGGVAVLNTNLAVEKAVADEDGNNIQETYAKKTEIAEAIEVDSELSTTSMNPVQNKVITNALQQKAGTNDIATLNKNITQLQNNKADKTEVPKLVKVDGTTITMDDATKIIKLAQELQTKINSIDDKLAIANVVNNLVTTKEGYALDARQGMALNGLITSLKKSVSDGKSAIASAITAKGVSTSSDAPFSTMAANIKNISTGVNLFEIFKDNKLSILNGYTSDYITRLVSSNAYQGGGYPFSSSDGAINVWYVCPTNGGVGLLDNRYILYDYTPGATYSGYIDYFSIKIYDKTTGETKTYNNVTSVSLASSFKLNNNGNQIIKISK